MPKKKKTLKQKMLADTRREQEVQTLYSYQAPLVTDEKSKVPRTVKPHVVSTINYQYLGADLRKTLLFTGFVVLIELVINYFL